MTTKRDEFVKLLDEALNEYRTDGEFKRCKRAAVLAAYDAARTTADYWKAEHVAANVEIERLKNAGREGQPVAWRYEGGTRWHDAATAPAPDEPQAVPIEYAYTHPAPKADAAADWVCVPREPTEAMCRAAVVYANGNAVYKNVTAEVLRIEEGIYAEVYAAMLAASPARVGEKS